MSQRPARILTGITTSGTPHLGNYVGAIRPAIAASRAPNTDSFYFLADLHSLIKAQDPARTQRSTLEIAATWLAAGLQPDKVWFYRQSDIPEITELTWLLTCVAGKGILNRAHAYKAAVDRNRADGEDDDAGVTAGLFMYPVLMAADILIFNADKVPVGRDQVQHIEMARDFGQRFNHVYGRDYFTLPEAVVDDNVATLPGLDGRKMSKSYGNTIPLFAPTGELKKLVFSILTDSRAPGEPKDAEGSPLFQLYQAFASKEETAAFAQAYADGIGWGDAKQQVFARVEREIAPMRERYLALVARPGDIEDTLRDGARRLREEYATPLLAQLREAVGLRDLSNMQLGAMEAESTVDKPPLATFKQYREGDGKFYFKLVEGDRVLLQSAAFDAPRDAGQAIAALKRGTLAIADAPAALGDGVDVAQVQAALDALSVADADKAAKAGVA
ncbi:tryptophan--tRNA ligase [Luteimonas aestuarii]|uniref:Tryptophan--tRNA ligase n=1 Tax=Luteimonas aestuarii TaxID=453837 RepID=A0A4R5TSC5_9GAMM|nr:tryptophan--tRNA ligase [Luteimonas aestuarii]TDK24338.1 tryptophan--tRNA ligase [Luteimonas aestuarii]